MNGSGTGSRTGFRAWRRRLRAGLPAALGLGGGAFLIPYRYAGTLPPPGARPPYAAVAALFDGAAEEFAAWLARIEAHRASLLAIGSAPPPSPRWTQDWFPRLDGAMAYVMARTLAPARIVEVDSGHSTRFFARAVTDGALDTAIVAIDPAPRAALEGLPQVTLDRRTAQQAGPSAFAALAAGDILAIDSSHILMPASDVDFLLNHVLPALPAGIVVHFHDIFLPDDYPESWAWRGYNEQLGVATLLSGGGWRPLFTSRYAVTRMADAVAAGVLAQLPLVDGAYESSLWLKKG